MHIHYNITSLVTSLVTRTLLVMALQAYYKPRNDLVIHELLQAYRGEYQEGAGVNRGPLKPIHAFHGYL